MKLNVRLITSAVITVTLSSDCVSGRCDIEQLQRLICISRHPHHSSTLSLTYVYVIHSTAIYTRRHFTWPSATETLSNVAYACEIKVVYISSSSTV